MVTVKWAEFTEADVTSRGAPVGEWDACLHDADNNTYRVTIRRDAIVSRRHDRPSIICLDEFSTPFTRYTRDNAVRIAAVIDEAFDCFEADLPYHAVYDRRPELFRMRVSTAQVPARSNIGPHPHPAGSDATVKFSHDGSWMADVVVEDAYGNSHHPHFSRHSTTHPNRVHFNYLRSPYAAPITESRLTATFAAIRAAQRELQREYRLSLNSTIQLTERPQRKATDAELDALPS